MADCTEMSAESNNRPMSATHDIVEQLREAASIWKGGRIKKMVLAAADEIAWLRTELEIVTVHMTHVKDTHLHIIEGLREQLEEARRG